VIDLALKAYLEKAKIPGASNAVGMDAGFKHFVMGQIKLFIFAGHDTTSAAVVFTYHWLSQHPDILAKVRKEHDIFGPDSSTVGSTITSWPPPQLFPTN
jgi:hypothetical protein